ncbi:MAG TPA: cyclodeaminase/cyclohydrolase family protein [Thermomicrobiales bacterium]|nr:cyclodeaminase/cyclohydrolase family protein [Thermomicrobiales bacterium]
MPESAFDRPPMRERTIGGYLDMLGSSDPTPGAGSAAGLLGALGASLGLMVISLTSSEDEGTSRTLDTARESLVRLRDRFTTLAEADERVFQGYRDAADMPKGTPEEKRARKAAMQEALKQAASVPLKACETAVELARTIVPVQEHGNPFLLSDAQVAMLYAATCFEASRVNVNVNLAMINDDAWITEVANHIQSLAADLRATSARVNP